MAGLDLRISGVTFASIKEAIVAFFFKHAEMTKEELEEARGFVLPMQHNFKQPIEPGTQDTWIQFWIDNDDRLTQDGNDNGLNRTTKVARVTVRFLGTRAESWAKSLHHLCGRESGNAIWHYYCNAQMLPYVFPIIPVNIDYFGVGNTTLAFNVSLLLQYTEILDYRIPVGEAAKRLMYIGIAAGLMSEKSDVETLFAVLEKIDSEADGE